MRAPPPLPRRRLRFLVPALLVGMLGWTQVRPVHAEFRRDLAVEACRAAGRGDHAAALELSQRLLQGAPDVGMAWRVHAYVLSQASFVDIALEAYGEAQRLDARDAISPNNAGTLLLAQGRAEEALESFDRALRINPQYADALNNRGAALERLGRLDEAEGAYRAALAAWPRHAKAANNLGALALKRGDARAAEQNFRRALSNDSSLVAAQMNLAMLREGDRDDEAWLAELDVAAAAPDASAATQARALGARAGAAARRGDMAAARDLYLKALALTPRDAALLNNLGVVEDQLGQDREALLHLGEALSLEPTLYVARNNVGIVHVHRGELDLAESAFRDLLRDAPEFHRAHYNLGVLLAARGQAEPALQSFLRAIRLAPGDAETVYNLAMMRRRLGGSAFAERRGYELALRLDPDMAEVHLAMGMLLADPSTPARIRDPRRARGHLERFLELARASDEQGRLQAEGWLAWLAAQAAR